MSGRGMRSYGP